jgi:UDP-N-acetylglucosamine 2-epimerase (non-hydrolysing)
MTHRTLHLVEPADPIPVMVCFGTRPEVIKLAPVLDAIREDPRLVPIGVSTAQHREMLDQALDTFGIVPDVDLGLMEPGQSIDSLASLVLGALGPIVRTERPRAIVVQGDTTTALCAALAAFWMRVPVAHVEAGLRTWDRTSPFPEEANRQMIGAIADWHFCPTVHAAQNLRREGVSRRRIHVTGNTVVDALHAVLQGPHGHGQLPPRHRTRRLLVTMHRRESQGEVQRALVRMLVRIAAERDVEVVMPVHPNPAVREVIAAEASGCEGITLVEPVEYATFVRLMRSSDVILTDSGGMQEEAPVLGVPLLVMRDTTERPEGVEAGCVRLCGTEPETVERALLELLDEPAVAASMAIARQPYGDGTAARRIAAQLAVDLADPRPDGPHERPPRPIAVRPQRPRRVPVASPHPAPAPAPAPEPSPAPEPAHATTGAPR